MAIHQQVTNYIYYLRKKWDKLGYSRRSINTGQCENFARDLKKKFPEGKAIWGDDYPELFINGVDNVGHCFFEFKGRYYDSECSSSVKFPEHLPFYRRSLSFREKIIS